MSRQNDSDFPQSELDMIEQAMSSMMQGTVSMLFHSLFGPEQNSGFNSGIFENTSDMQQHQQHSAMLGGDGSDFKRLANKSRKNRGIPTTIEEQDTVQEHPASPPAAQPPPLPEPRRSAGMIIRDEPDLMNRRTDNDMARIATPPPTMMNLLQFMFGSHTGQMATPGGNNETGTLLDLMLPSDDQLFNSMEPEITGHPRQDMEGNPSQQEGMGVSKK
ncbi:hypothetical protein BDA99DRAFT_506419 [Phascolomyces articulosus]|uniref:Uncharacterized protein n=1 Tax=Phascolomyces articulosus TaxID=60185 RepID=A0AAD5K333_9FUNG|nr:hypothetical protein BDA99DRAFT_506419 [Phascolomyces articulosus]